MAGREEEEVSGQAVERSKGVRRRMIDDAVTVRGKLRRIWQTDQGVGSVFDCRKNRPGLAALLQGDKAGRRRRGCWATVV